METNLKARAKKVQMQINFKFTIIMLGRSEHHDFRFQNEM